MILQFIYTSNYIVCSVSAKCIIAMNKHMFIINIGATWLKYVRLSVGKHVCLKQSSTVFKSSKWTLLHMIHIPEALAIVPEMPLFRNVNTFLNIHNEKVCFKLLPQYKSLKWVSMSYLLRHYED